MNQEPIVKNHPRDDQKTIAYLDTSAIDHLHQRWGASDADELKLRATIREGHIVIPVSVVTLEEFFFDGQTLVDGNLSPKALLMLDLVDPAMIVKPAQRLIADDVRSFAVGDHAGSPFVSGEALFQLSLALNQLRHGDGRANLPVLRKIAALAGSQKDAFHSGMLFSHEQALKLAKTDGLDFAQIPFGDFLAATSPSLVAEFARALGVEDECRHRGLDGLLGLPTVAMATSLPLSLIYGLLAEKRVPGRSDGRDQQHAVMAASCADIFVTDDKDLKRLTRRINFPGLQLLNLRDFLAAL